jgi:hypothetical protein
MPRQSQLDETTQLCPYACEIGISANIQILAIAMREPVFCVSVCNAQLDGDYVSNPMCTLF